MNKYVKEYMHRGLIFGGFGPIIAGIILFIIDKTGGELELSGFSVFLAIISTYICAFVHAGASVFPQIEHWGKVKAMFWQFVSIYAVYMTAYTINGWLPMKPLIIAIFTSAFLGGFLIVWLVVYLVTRKSIDEMNSKLNS